jgi:hypothetical protein
VIRGAADIDFYLYPSLAWSNPVKFSPSITSAPVSVFGSTANLVIGSTDVGAADLGEMRVSQIKYIPTNGSPTNVLLSDWSGQGTNEGVSSAVRGTSGTNPMAELLYNGNNAARFDGTDDSLTFSPAMPLNAVSGVSIFIYGPIFRTTGDNDLVFLGSNDADPRILLRIDDGVVKLIARRLDAEATAEISASQITGNLYISASIDYAAGTMALYLNKEPKAVGALTSAGLTSATNSSETRFMAGQGGANPSAGDLYSVTIIDEATNPVDHAAMWASLISANS